MAFATITTQGASPGSCKVVMPDGSSFFVSASICTQFGLQGGQDLADDRCNLILEALHRETCRKKALSLLAMHEQTRAGLRLKLEQRGFSVAVIDSVLERLQMDGLLSDYRFAESMVFTRQRKNPEGRYVLLQRLAALGVDSNIAVDAVDRWFLDNEAVMDAVRRAARRIIRRNQDDSGAVVRSLQKKGFTRAEIRDALGDELQFCDESV